MTLKKTKWLFIIGILFFMLLLAMYIHLTSGAFTMTTPEVFKTLLRIDSTEQFDLVIFDFRLPRIITAALVGMGLAMAGVVLQGITKMRLLIRELSELTPVQDVQLLSSCFSSMSNLLMWK